MTITSGWSCPSSTSTSSRGSTSPSPDHLKTSHQDDDSSDATACGPLPQHTHYRIAVEEVCLPLDSFANGKQLVSLVLDTLHSKVLATHVPVAVLMKPSTAHCRVTNDPQTRLLHCDVSSGNIMIYPKIKYNGAEGRASLAWTGILSDWEMAKSMDSAQVPLKTSPGHRLVCSSHLSRSENH